MEQTPTLSDMADPMKMVKVSEKNFNRLKTFGFAGESINTALSRLLDIAEKNKEKKD